MASGRNRSPLAVRLPTNFLPPYQLASPLSVKGAAIAVEMRGRKARQRQRVVLGKKLCCIVGIISLVAVEDGVFFSQMKAKG